MIYAYAAIAIGLAGLLTITVLAARARRRNRPIRDSRAWTDADTDVRPYLAQIDRDVRQLAAAASVPPHFIDHVDTTAVLPWAERAARAAAMSRHPSVFRPTRSGFEALARSVDEALLTVEQVRGRYAFPYRPARPAGDDTAHLPRIAYPPVIANTDTTEDDRP